MFLHAACFLSSAPWLLAAPLLQHGVLDGLCPLVGFLPWCADPWQIIPLGIKMLFQVCIFICVPSFVLFLFSYPTTPLHISVVLQSPFLSPFCIFAPSSLCLPLCVITPHMSLCQCCPCICCLHLITPEHQCPVLPEWLHGCCGHGVQRCSCSLRESSTETSRRALVLGRRS